MITTTLPPPTASRTDRDALSLDTRHTIPDRAALFSHLEDIACEAAGALIAAEDGETDVAIARIRDTITRCWLVMMGL